MLCVQFHTHVRVYELVGVNAVKSYVLHVYLPTEKAFQSLFVFHPQYTFLSHGNLNLLVP